MANLRKYKMFELNNLDFFLWWMGGIASVGMLGWMIGSSGKLVLNTSHKLDNFSADSSFDITSFKVKKDQTYRVKITSGKLSNNWLAVGVNFQDDDDLVVNEFEADFWHESGYDSDGYWSEHDYTKILYFKATKTEKLSGEVYWVGGRYGKRLLKSNTIKVRISRAGTKVAANYFKYLFWVFGGITLLLVGIIYGDD